MDPPRSATKPDLHPLLARRYFDKLEDQHMANSPIPDKVAAFAARERQITRDRRDNEVAAADLLRRERSVIEVERRLEKREKEIKGRPTREELEMLEAQLEEAKREANRNKHKFQSAVDEHNYLAKKYHNAKHEHEKTKRDLGGEIVRLTKVTKNLQDRLSETEKKLESQRLENLELKMRNAELEMRDGFLEKEYRRRLTGSEEKEEKSHRRRPSRIPVATKEKKNDDIPVSRFAKSTVASRARAVSSSPPPAMEKRAAPTVFTKEQDQATNSEPSGPRTMLRAASIASAPDSAESSFTSLPPPAYGFFAPTRSSNREAMSQGCYSAADLLSRGPPVPPHAAVPPPKIPPPPIDGVEANTAKKITPSTSKPRPASYVSSNDDDIVYLHSAATVGGDSGKKHIKKKYSQDFRDAVKRSLPWLKRETREIYSEAFL